jgi:ribosomal protein L9
MFEGLRDYLVPQRLFKGATPEMHEEQEKLSAELVAKRKALSQSAKEFEETAKEFLEDKEKFEGARRGKY